MKKSFLIFLFIILCLCSCSKKEEKKENTTVTIWHDKEDEVIEVLSEALKKLEPEITVIFEKKVSLTESLKLVGNDNKSAPDMYIFAHDKIGVYAEMGILVPITDILGEEALSGYISLTANAGNYKGKNYQLPLYYETLLFLYNKKYMKEDEIPKTTEELYSYMVKKTKYGHYGFVEQHSTPYYASGWIHAFGIDLSDKDGNPNLNSQKMKDALLYHKKFVGLMPGETEYATVNTLFTEGKAHSTINGPWFIPTVRNAGIDVGIAPMPKVDQTGEALAPYCGVQGVHVLKAHYSEKKEAIKKVLEALSSPQVGIDLALSTGCAPALSGCYEDERVMKDEVVMAMKETAENAVAMPNIPELDVLWSVTGNLLTNVNMRDMDIDTACDEAQKKAEELIEAMR